MLTSKIYSISKMNNIFLSEGKQLVLDLLKTRLYGIKKSYDIYQLAIWEEALFFSVSQRVALIVYDYLKTNSLNLRFDNVPNEIIKKLSTYYRNNAIRNTILKQELLSIGRLFSSHNIDLIPLKGVLLSEYLYNDPYIRPSVDIDILVRPDMQEKAFAILQDCGYIWGFHWNALRMKVYRANTNHWPLINTKKKIIVELHHKFLSNSRSADIDIEEFWMRASSHSYDSVPFKMMCREDIFFYLMLHSAKEFWSSLIHLYDLATFVIMNPAIDWILVINNAKKNHCMKRLITNCILLNKIFDVQFPDIVKSILVESAEINMVIDSVLKRIFSNQETRKGVRSTFIWLDYRLADRFRDRAYILSNKILNQGIKILTYPLGDYK